MRKGAGSTSGPFGSRDDCFLFHPAPDGFIFPLALRSCRCRPCFPLSSRPRNLLPRKMRGEDKMREEAGPEPGPLGSRGDRLQSYPVMYESIVSVRCVHAGAAHLIPPPQRDARVVAEGNERRWLHVLGGRTRVRPPRAQGPLSRVFLSFGRVECLDVVVMSKLPISFHVRIGPRRDLPKNGGRRRDASGSKTHAQLLGSRDRSAPFHSVLVESFVWALRSRGSRPFSSL